MVPASPTASSVSDACVCADTHTGDAAAVCPCDGVVCVVLCVSVGGVFELAILQRRRAQADGPRKDATKPCADRRTTRTWLWLCNCVCVCVRVGGHSQVADGVHRGHIRQPQEKGRHTTHTRGE